MIIVNQDKTEIINFDNTLNISLYPKCDDLDNEIGYELFAGMKAPDDNYRILGCYKTEERAKEVLEKILEQYALNNLVFTPNFNVHKEASHYTPVFYMPEK